MDANQLVQTCRKRRGVGEQRGRGLADLPCKVMLKQKTHKFLGLVIRRDFNKWGQAACGVRVEACGVIGKSVFHKGHISGG